MRRTMIVFQIAAIILLCVFIYFSAKMIAAAYQKIVKAERFIAADTMSTQGEYSLRIIDKHRAVMLGDSDSYVIDIDNGNLRSLSDHDVVRVKRYFNRAIKKTQDFSAR
jgi:cell division protein FtsI/penicillin-binding protein 2